jgi:peptidoglycan glycosyltransferase
MKVMTASTALELGEVKTTTQLTGPAEYKGVRNFESGEFGTLSFASALQNSVNTAFAQVAERIGPKRLKGFADLFGFNRAPAMLLDAAKPSFPFPADEGDLLWSAIGQAQTLATPLQMATIAATIANGGKRMEPRIALSDNRAGERVVSKETARVMTTLMESVVQGGTGVAAQISGVRVAGKTGTAEVDVGGERRNHAWFICFAPANDPKVAIAVVSEYGGVGGQVAAPLARAILTSVLPLIR